MQTTQPLLETALQTALSNELWLVWLVRQRAASTPYETFATTDATKCIAVVVILVVACARSDPNMNSITMGRPQHGRIRMHFFPCTPGPRFRGKPLRLGQAALRGPVHEPRRRRRRRLWPRPNGHPPGQSKDHSNRRVPVLRHGPPCGYCSSRKCRLALVAALMFDYLRLYPGSLRRTRL